MIKELIKVIQQENHVFKDPITEFLECLYINYDFEGAQQKLQECEHVGFLKAIIVVLLFMCISNIIIKITKLMCSAFSSEAFSLLTVTVLVIALCLRNLTLLWKYPLCDSVNVDSFICYITTKQLLILITIVHFGTYDMS